MTNLINSYKTNTYSKMFSIWVLYTRLDVSDWMDSTRNMMNDNAIQLEDLVVYPQLLVLLMEDQSERCITNAVGESRP